jgi:hypothetical protein
MLELNGKPSKAFKCYHVLNWFFLPKPGFWNLFEFSAVGIILKSVSPTF